jgi:hypothetical protein
VSKEVEGICHDSRSWGKDVRRFFKESAGYAFMRFLDEMLEELSVGGWVSGCLS